MTQLRSPVPADFPISCLPDGPFNMAQYCIGAPAQLFADKIALQVISDIESNDDNEAWTYLALENAVLRAANGLASLGLKKGDRIVIRLDNTSDYAILFFGAIAAGLVPLPTTTELTAKEANFLVTDSGAKVLCQPARLSTDYIPSGVHLLTESDVAALKTQHEPTHYATTNAEDAAYLIYTSGTTSKPKGVVHAHRVAFGRNPTYQGWYGITHEDRMLHAGAFNWTYTLGTGLIDPWANGAETIIYTGGKRPELWPTLIRQSHATLFAAVPGVFRQILKYAPPGPIDLGELRHGLMAGEMPPSNLFDDWKERTGTPLLEALGMSEISTYISTAPGMVRKPGSAGKAQPGRRVGVLPIDGGTEPLPPGEEGLLAVHRSDKGLMLGYWNRAEEETEVYRGDWFMGGDLAVMDCDGYITHCGRANDVMKALGYRVSPFEVEAGLHAHPRITDVACASIAVREDVSVIGAFVVTVPGADLTKEEVFNFAAENLASYKRPREIIFVDELPRTRNGKVQRSALPALYNKHRHA